MLVAWRCVPVRNAVRWSFSIVASAVMLAGALQSVQAQTQAVPSDKFYAYKSNIPPEPGGSVEGTYQWGMQQLKMPDAWAIERGTAYVGVLDEGGVPCQANTGTATTPCNISHPDLRQNFRPQFSRNFVGGAYPDNTIINYMVGEIVPSGSEPAWGSGIGHGLHVAGILAATPEYLPLFSNNDPAGSGVTGTCWTCSYVALKSNIKYYYANAMGIMYAVNHGLQVVNMSFGDIQKDAGPGFGISKDCSNSADRFDWAFVAWCDAIEEAKKHELILVAASGNDYLGSLNFPASDPRVIAVGGTKVDNGFWNNGYGVAGTTCGPNFVGKVGTECGSNFGPKSDGSEQLVAPAMNIVSTVFPGVNYNTQFHAGDKYGPAGAAGYERDGYGDFTGTSMAAPHVSGIIALMRSVNPLLSPEDKNGVPGIKTILTDPANTQECLKPDPANPQKFVKDTKCGRGFPNAGKAVRAVLVQGAPANADVKNRLTPLFSFYADANNGNDHFYTVVPQMAVAALTTSEENTDQGGPPVRRGSLLPQPKVGNVVYTSIGTPTPDYSSFPTFSPCIGLCPPTNPKAVASVFVSHVNPIAGGGELVPLYRYSWASSNSNHVSHVYSTDKQENWTSAGYQLDGIEGYIFPKTPTSPAAGAKKLCRKYNSNVDDYVLFVGDGDGTDCSRTNLPEGSGYNGPTTASEAYIGWVFPVVKPQPVCASSIWCTDSTPPTVTLTQPLNNATVSGTIKVTATASDNVAVTSVTLLRDNQVFALLTTPPYSVELNTTILGNGMHSLQAKASDSAGNVGSSNVVNINVNNVQPTTTALETSGSPSVFGQTVTFTATVYGNSPTGSVTFKDGEVVLCLSAPVSGSKASCETSSLNVGSHGIVAAYSGDSNNGGSTSPALTQIVNKVSTSTLITAHTPNPSIVGTPILIGASVAAMAPGVGVPDGEIQVSDGTVNCKIPLPSSTSTCSLTPGNTGVLTLTATYSGSTSFATSTVSVNHQVNPAIPPDAPTIGVATAGAGSATVAFTPGSIGSGTLSYYTAKCGSIAATGISSPIVVNGLIGGSTYTCMVSTTTSAGTSGWSAASNSVTPMAPPPAAYPVGFNILELMPDED